MKAIKNFFVVILILVSNNVMGQEFSFKLVFEDAIGQRDTLIFGYDLNATDSVDIGFEEVNIISKAFDPKFDVRITDVVNSLTSGFQLKKQIIKKNCDDWPYANPIIIKCKNWPVTAYWDNSLFIDSCRAGSILTSIPQGGWWDTRSPSDLFRVELKNQDQVTFSANYDDYVNENYAFVNDDHDTISIFWVAMAKNSILTVNIQDVNFKNDLVLFPNPATDRVYVKGISSDQIEQINLINLSGTSIVPILNDDFIDLTKLHKGVYFLMIKLKNKSLISKKLIKL